MGNILNFGEEKVKKELKGMAPEELLSILFDDKKCDELVQNLGPLVEQKCEAMDLTEDICDDAYVRVAEYLDLKYGNDKNSEAAAEMITMCSTISMKIMAYALSMLPREERHNHLDRMKEMALMYTELFIHRMVCADSGDE